MQKSTFFRSEDINFWSMLEGMVERNGFVINNLRNSKHPEYINIQFPVAHGYIGGTHIDKYHCLNIFVGTKDDEKINGVICVIDTLQGEVSMKVIYNCTDEEVKNVCNLFYNLCQGAIFHARR